MWNLGEWLSRPEQARAVWYLTGRRAASRRTAAESLAGVALQQL